MCSCGPPHMANQKQDDQLEHSYSSYVVIRDVTLKTCRRRWIIGRRGERGSGISVLAARHDDDPYTRRILSSEKTCCHLINSKGHHIHLVWKFFFCIIIIIIKDKYREECKIEKCIRHEISYTWHFQKEKKKKKKNSNSWKWPHSHPI